MRKRLCNGDVSFLPMSLVSSVKNQSKLPKLLLVGGQCLDRIMCYLKPFDFDDFSLKLTKDLRRLIFAWKQSFEQMKIFLLHGTKTKISFDAMKLSPFCKLHLIAKSIGSPRI